MYLGNTSTNQSFISGTDYFNGTGAQTAFTLSRNIASVNDIEVVINNVVQQPNTAYTVLNNVVTFTSAPSAGTQNIYVRYLSTATQTITPGQGTVGYAQLNSDMQAKQGIGFKNRIINGAMMIDQRNAGASVTATTAFPYTVDRWSCGGSVTSKFTVQQSTTAPTGFGNSVLITSSSAYTVGASEQYSFRQAVEANNMYDLGWGTANAKTVTVSFWVRSSLTGTFGGSFYNYSGNYSYPFTYTISAANTWEQKSIIVVGPTAGTWNTGSTGFVWLEFSIGAGATLLGTSGSWSANYYTGAIGQTNLVATSGATLYVSGVQLEVGTQATTFDYRSYGTELALCQRYYEKIGGSGGTDITLGSGAVGAGYDSFSTIGFNVTKRAAPTVTKVGTWAVVNCSQPSVSSASLNTVSLVTSSTAGSGQVYTNTNGTSTYITASAEL